MCVWGGGGDGVAVGRCWRGGVMGAVVVVAAVVVVEVVVVLLVAAGVCMVWRTQAASQG